MRGTVGLLVTLAGAVGAVVLLAWVFQRQLIYYPLDGVPEPTDVGLPGAEAVTLATGDGLALGAWFVPADGRARATVIVFNGNAGHRAFRAPLAAALRTRGLAVLLFDYRGYGDNPGAPTEVGLRLDARAAREHVIGRADVDPTRLVYFGESLGTAVATELAAQHPPAGLVLRSPFTSLVSVGRRHYPFLPVGWLLEDRFDSLAAIDGVTAPLLVIAGDRDRIVPPAESRALHAAARAPKDLLMLSGGHNDPALLVGEELLDAMLRFVDRLP